MTLVGPRVGTYYPRARGVLSQTLCQQCGHLVWGDPRIIARHPEARILCDVCQPIRHEAGECLPQEGEEP